MRAVLVLALLLAGCATVEFPRPPADKLICDAEPDRPVGLGPGGAVTDEENGEYLRKLRGTGQSCRDDVDWLRVWFSRLR